MALKERYGCPTITLLFFYLVIRQVPETLLFSALVSAMTFLPVSVTSRQPWQAFVGFLRGSRQVLSGVKTSQIYLFVHLIEIEGEQRTGDPYRSSQLQGPFWWANHWKMMVVFCFSEYHSWSRTTNPTNSPSKRSIEIQRTLPPPPPAPYSVDFCACQKTRPVAYEPGAMVPAVGCAVGAWLGAIPLSLDWERPWQVPSVTRVRRIKRPPPPCFPTLFYRSHASPS